MSPRCVLREGRGGVDREAQRQVQGPLPDPIGRPRSKTFLRKAAADRFAREVEVDKDRGSWIDPRKSEISAANMVRDDPDVVAVAGADVARHLPTGPRAVRPAGPR